MYSSWALCCVVNDSIIPLFYWFCLIVKENIIRYVHLSSTKLCDQWLIYPIILLVLSDVKQNIIRYIQLSSTILCHQWLNSPIIYRVCFDCYVENTMQNWMQNPNSVKMQALLSANASWCQCDWAYPLQIGQYLRCGKLSARVMEPSQLAMHLFTAWYPELTPIWQSCIMCPR